MGFDENDAGAMEPPAIVSVAVLASDPWDPSEA
jgi:hypothetical protein